MVVGMTKMNSLCLGYDLYLKTSWMALFLLTTLSAEIYKK